MPSAEDIVAMVNQREDDTGVLRARMDTDYSSWWRMDEHQETAGYKSYTTAESRIYAKKMIATLQGSVMNLRTPQGNDPREKRDKDNLKEQFLIGGFRQNDERLALMDEPSVRASMSWHIAVRGRTVGRCLINTKPDGTPYMDATPWDSRHVMWEMGPDGLEWICHKYTRSPQYIKRMYGKSVSSEEAVNGSLRNDIIFYDFYDRERNQVVVPALIDTDKFMKNDLHGLNDRVPAWISSNNIQPPIIHGKVFDNSNSFDVMMGEYGESIFAENRRVWEVHNDVMSIILELVARARKPLMLVKSPDGLRVIEYDPYKEGANLSLRNDESIEVPNLLTASPDTGALLTIIAGEMQRGALPPIMFGDSPLAISGFAMNTLRGSIFDKAVPLIDAQTNGLVQISDIWCDHFVQGGFEGIQLSGRGNNRQWFSEFIQPEEIEDLPRPVIKLTPQVPQDDAAKMNMAQMARQVGSNGLPLYDDLGIHERILEDQDSDAIMAAVYEQMAYSMNPFAMLDVIIDALVKRGDMEKAQYYIGDKMELLQAKMMAAQAGAPIPGTNMPGGGDAQQSGLPPEIAPNAAQGRPAPTPTPQQGPLVPPGQPRPGAQNNQRRRLTLT